MVHGHKALVTLSLVEAVGCLRKNMSQKTCVGPAWPRVSCVTLSESLHCSGPPFLNRKMELIVWISQSHEGF